MKSYLQIRIFSPFKSLFLAECKNFLLWINHHYLLVVSVSRRIFSSLKIRKAKASVRNKTLLQLTQKFPQDPWEGSTEHGLSLLSGWISIDGEQQQFNANCWSPSHLAKFSQKKPLSFLQKTYLSRLNDFDWLRDLDASGHENGHMMMQKLVNSWLQNEKNFSQEVREITDRPDIMGQRLRNLIIWYPRLVSKHKKLEAKLWYSICRQAINLSLAMEPPPKIDFMQFNGAIVTHKLHPIIGIFRAYKGLFVWEFLQFEINSAAPTSIRDRSLKKLAAQFSDWLNLILLPDGNSLAHNAYVLLLALRELIEIVELYKSFQLPIPQAIQSGVDRMAPAVRFFRHSDGKLALFQGSSEGEVTTIDQILARSHSHGHPPKSLSNSGFERIVARTSVLLMQTTANHQLPKLEGSLKLRILSSQRNLARLETAALAFEFSNERERIITSIGCHSGLSGEWRRSIMRASAYSTQSIVAVAKLQEQVAQLQRVSSQSDASNSTERLVQYQADVPPFKAFLNQPQSTPLTESDSMNDPMTNTAPPTASSKNTIQNQHFYRRNSELIQPLEAAILEDEKPNFIEKVYQFEREYHAATQQPHSGGVEIDAQTDHLRNKLNLVQKRRLWLSDHGDDLRGEDHLEFAYPEIAAQFQPSIQFSDYLWVIRFHFHPSTRLTRVYSDDGQCNELALHLSSGRIWHLEFDSGNYEIGKTGYLGTAKMTLNSHYCAIRLPILQLPMMIIWKLSRQVS